MRNEKRVAAGLFASMLWLGACAVTACGGERPVAEDTNDKVSIDEPASRAEAIVPSTTVCRCSCQLPRGGGGGTFNICTDGKCQSPGWDKDITDPTTCKAREGTECQGSSAYLGTDTTHCYTDSMWTTGTLTNCKVIEKGLD